TAGGTADLPPALLCSGVFSGVESVREFGDPLTWTRSSGTLFAVQHRTALLSGEGDHEAERGADEQNGDAGQGDEAAEGPTTMTASCRAPA
ncbi:MAG: hypothetical protein LC799_13315, partial [Actinobacteria bacterium]|nr:hypothetical protein [Actinomycetota bacterium]